MAARSGAAGARAAIASADPGVTAAPGDPATDDLEHLLGERVLRSFVGLVPTPEVLTAIAAGRTSGVSLYRAKNIETPDQVRALTAALQAARPRDEPPVIVALDQEGGQLQAIGAGATAWPGNLALAASGSSDLALRAGAAIGAELAAMGVNVDFAPVCDLLDDPRSPLMGTRTFGDDPILAGRLAVAMVRGLQSAGVAATLKHFPGHGSVAGDSHHGLPVAPVDAATLRSRELVPFGAGIGAGARLVMLGHLAVPAATDGRTVPATLAPELARALLRDELGFEGVTVSDALDMAALYSSAGPGAAAQELPAIAVRAAMAGLDLLLTVHDPMLEDRVVEALVDAARSGRLYPADVRSSAGRIRSLRAWLGQTEGPPLSVVGSAAHAALARAIAERSSTLIRDRDGLLPIRPDGIDRVVVVSPRPVDLTPADTSSYLRLGLAEVLRETGFRVDEIDMPLDPTPADVGALTEAIGPGPASSARVLAVVGSIDALVHDGQARLVDAFVRRAIPVIAVALRTPVDVLAYPSVGTALATYGSQPPNLRALAAGLVGRIPFTGRLPVRFDPDHHGDGR